MSPAQPDHMLQHRSRMRLIAIAVVLSSAVFLLPALATADDAATRRDRMYAEIEQWWQARLKAHPEMATYLGDSRYNDRLGNYSPTAVALEQQAERDELARFKAIDSSDFAPEDKLNLQLQLRELQQSVDNQKFSDWEMPVNQMNGIHLDYASLPTQMPFETIKDYDNYIARLKAIPRVFAEITTDMRLGIKDRLMPPKYLLEKVGEQARGIGIEKAGNSPFARPLDRIPGTFTDEDRMRIKADLLNAISHEVLPAYSQFARFVCEEYAPHGRTEFGIWALPDGDSRYRAAVKSETTTTLSPEQIHAMGLRQVAEIEAEMLKLAKAQGYPDLKSFNAHIRGDKAMYGKSGEQIFGLYKSYAEQMQARLPKWFGKQPPTPLQVVPMDSFRAPDAVPADYSPGTSNGSRPGRINVNEFAPEQRLLLNVEAIAYHEGVPGHHMQFSIAQNLTGLPAFRKNASYDAYSEGWALYAEKLGREIGFYQNPMSEYGRLENEMWRSVRLVVDTGVHSRHWSRQQMIDFFTEHTAMDAQNISTETDRYIAWPAQALSYKMGQMAILKLREEARHQLGAAFDIRKFHDAVLEEGPLPLDVLEDHVRQWIQTTSAAKTSARSNQEIVGKG